MKTYDEIFISLGKEEIRIAISKEMIGYDMKESWRSISHNHSSFEFHYITEGNVELCIQNSQKNDKSWDSDTFMLNEGDICIISPNVYHNTILGDNKGKKLSFNFEIKSEKLNEYFTFPHGFQIFRKLPVSYFVNSLVKDTVNEISSYGDSKRKAYFMIIFSEIIKNLAKEKDILSYNKKQYTFEIQRKYIIDDFFDFKNNQQLSLTTLAKKLGLSTKQTTRVLKEETGKSFADLLVEKKISYAKMLLDESYLSIEEISEKVNYCTCSGFIKAFKKMTGTTPYSYRKNKRENKNELK